MKKIISLLLMVAMLFGVSAFAAEEEFTLHSGTTFGMSVDEVVKLEKDAGFNVEKGEQKAAEGMGLAFSVESSVRATGKIAGFDNTTAYYSFEDGELYRMCYVFEGNCFQELENALEKKYGTTEYCSLSGMVMPEFTAQNTTYPFFFTGIVSDEPNYHRRTTRESYEYSQRLITLSETEYVYIECQHYFYDFGMQLGKLIGTNQYETYHTKDRTQVTYHLLDAKTAEKLLNALGQLDSDL